MQKSGLEWLWRITQEPKLLIRYFKDGLVFIYLLITCVFPYALFLYFHKKYLLVKETPIVSVSEENSAIKIKITGICNHLNQNVMKKYFKEAASNDKDVIIDFSEAEYIDNYFLGILLLLFKYKLLQNKKLILQNVGKRVEKIFRLNLCNFLLTPTPSD